MDDWPPVVRRMVRAAKLENGLYDEVKADTTATRQAYLVVVIGAFASGMGTAIGDLLMPGLTLTEFFLLFLVGLVGAIIGWLIWSSMAYLLGTTIFKLPGTSASYGELLRTIGFANSPRTLSFFSFIPVIGVIVDFAVSVWTLVAGVIAVRQTLAFSTGRAIGVCVAGFALDMVFIWLVVYFVLWD